MEKGLVPNKVVPKLRGSVNVWREFVPVVQVRRAEKQSGWERSVCACLTS